MTEALDFQAVLKYNEHGYMSARKVRGYTMRINSNYSVYNLLDTMYQGNMALNSNKLNRNFFPANKAKSTGSLGIDSLQYINSIKTSSKDLKSSLKDLSGAAFSNRTVTSSDSDVMSVKFTGNSVSGINKMSVKIDQLAAGQVNEGARLGTSAKFDGSTGINKFKIETGGKTTELSVNVSASDTNKDVQQKMADAINKAGIGVKATVETDSATNSSMLKLESTKTGSDPKNSFKVTDVTGDLASRTGANDIARQGQDAIYSVNGGTARTSQSNTVSLGSGVSATFMKTSEEAVTVARGKDKDYAMNAVEKMVKSYNSLFTDAAQRTNDTKSQNLAAKMVNISKTYSSSLSDIGIGFDNSGRMTIDKQKMAQAAESGKLEMFFTANTGKSYGFTNQLGRLADNVSRNTSNYVSSSLFGSDLSENFSYSSYGSLIQYNYLGAGSIFDYTF